MKQLKGKASNSKMASIMTLANTLLFRKRTNLAVALRREFMERAVIGSGVRHGDMANFYGWSRVCWNQSISADLNMRVFEGAANGCCVVTDPAIGMKELFGDSVVTYPRNAEAEQVIETIDRVLVDGSWRDYGERARKICLDKHMYKHRVARVLEVMS